LIDSGFQITDNVVAVCFYGYNPFSAKELLIW